MPDRIEIASSGRARCRACRRAIGKGEERFAEAVPNPAAEGESQHYYHLACASERRPKPFAALLPTLDPPRPELAQLGAAAAFTLEHHRLERLGVLERAKSARAACRQCREPIEKGGWRVALQPIEEGRLGSWGFVHLACVGAYVGVNPSLERLTRYTELEASDSGEIARVLEALATPEPRSNEPDEAEPGSATGGNGASAAPLASGDDARREG